VTEAKPRLLFDDLSTITLQPEAEVLLPVVELKGKERSMAGSRRVNCITI
jgi:hypothetical protein